MVWKPEYAIGDKRVDEQHLRLFELYNQLCGVTPESVDHTRLLHELYSYAVFHFAEEEALMHTAGYPSVEVEAHTRSHRAFFNTLERLRTQSLETAFGFFREWLVHHILTEDRAIGRFLDARSNETRHQQERP